MAKSTAPIQYAKYVYTPLEVANAGYDGAKFAIENAAFGFDFPHIEKEDIGEYFARLLPWEICAVLGQTHNGKTLFVDWWEHAICKQIQAENRPDLLVHVSVEESLEAMSFYQHARYLGVATDKIATGKVELSQLEWSVTQQITI